MKKLIAAVLTLVMLACGLASAAEVSGKDGYTTLWTGSEYFACRLGAAGAEGSTVRYLDGRYNSTAEHDFGAPVLGISYAEKVYYAEVAFPKGTQIMTARKGAQWAASSMDKLPRALADGTDPNAPYLPLSEDVRGVASNGHMMVRGVVRGEPYPWWNESAKKFQNEYTTRPYCAYSYDGIEWRPAVLPGIDSVEVMVWPTPLPYNGKSFVLLNGGDAMGCYYSEDGINWTRLPDHGDWAGGTRGLLDTRFVWTGTQYIGRLAGFGGGVAGAPATRDERINAACFFDEHFNLTGQHDFGVPVTGVGYFGGSYYAQTGTDETGDRRVYCSSDQEKWTESDQRTIPAAAGWSPKSEPYYVTINGEYRTFDELIYSKNNRTMVPLRGIAEALGFTVEWDQTSGQAVCTKGDVTVRTDIGADTATVNGAPVKLDAPSELRSDRTFVPLRFFGQSFGMTVDWNQETRTAVLGTP